MKQFQGILLTALSIAVGLLLYDRFVQPTGQALFGVKASTDSKTTTPAKVEDAVAQLLAEEGF